MRMDGNARFPCYNSSFLDISTLEDETSMLPRRVEHTAPHPRRMERFLIINCAHFRHIVQEMHKRIISVSLVVCNVKKLAYLIQNGVIQCG
jgi:hypothetical protein